MKLFCLCLACLLFAVPSGLDAAPKAKKKAKSAAQAAAAPTTGEPVPGAASAAAPADSSANPMSAALGGFNFDTIKAMKIRSTANGGIMMDTNVIIRSPDLNLDCDHLVKDGGQNIMIATGNPVKVEQGQEMKAQCQRLIYDTEKKTYRLEGKPVVDQRQKDGRILRSRFDIITLTQVQEGKQPDVSFEMLPNAATSGVVEMLDAGGNKAKSNAKAAAKPAKKVNSSNLMDIKVPEIE